MATVEAVVMEEEVAATAMVTLIKIFDSVHILKPEINHELTFPGGGHGGGGGYGRNDYAPTSADDYSATSTGYSYVDYYGNGASDSKQYKKIGALHPDQATSGEGRSYGSRYADKGNNLGQILLAILLSPHDSYYAS